MERPWLLWDRCFQIDRQASDRFALGVVKNQITNHAGFYLRTCAAAYAHTTNAAFLRAIETFVSAFKNPASLSFAIDCDGSARLLPEPVSSKLRTLAETAEVNGNTTPQVAMMYVSRYENTGKTAFRDAIHRAAHQNLNSAPGLSPRTLGHSIGLQLAAWRSTARQEHLDKARAFADFALAKYFSGSPNLVPGTDTLALSLVELHLHILYITAVCYPPNTIDR